MISSLLLGIGLALLLEEPAPAKSGPLDSWKAGVEHRFLWIQNGKSVGETLFRVDVPAPGTSGARVRVQASRKYDRDGASHRGTGTTLLLEDGSPLHYEETVDLSSLGKVKSHREGTIEIQGGKARLQYRNRGQEAPVRSEHDIPRETYLAASQAVEHWAIFLSRLPPAFEKAEVNLFYPEFLRILRVTFTRTGKEKIQVGAEEIPVTRYSFRSDDGSLQGAVCLDAAGRLIQIEFPNASPELALRVVLTIPPASK